MVYPELSPPPSAFSQRIGVPAMGSFLWPSSGFAPAGPRAGCSTAGGVSPKQSKRGRTPALICCPQCWGCSPGHVWLSGLEVHMADTWAQFFIHQYFQTTPENLLGKCLTWEDLKRQRVNRIFSRGLFVFQEVQGVVILELTVLGCSQAYLKLKTLKVRSNSGGSGRGVGIWCSGDSREMREAE